MKFWQLVSIYRDCCDVLEIVLQENKWKRYSKAYHKFEELVQNQQREILDEILPEELICSVLKQDKRQLYISDGYLRLQPSKDSDAMTSILSVYHQYGGKMLEDILEFGSVKVS